MSDRGQKSSSQTARGSYIAEAEGRGAQAKIEIQFPPRLFAFGAVLRLVATSLLSVATISSERFSTGLAIR
jgi:hypothetical protein